MLNMDDELGDLLRVCVAHGRFIPCRREGVHAFEKDPRWVSVVRAYQQTTDPDLTWEDFVQDEALGLYG